MKNLKCILLFSLLSLCFFNCSNDDNGNSVTTGDPHYPMKSFLESGAVQINQTQVNSTVTFELGYRFKSFKNGQITALGIRVPDNESYRVTLWNMDTEEILAIANIQATAELLSFEDIAPVSVESGVDYFVSLSTSDYYRFGDNGNTIFPTEQDDIIILGYGTYIGNTQMIPTQFSTTAYLGVVDIEFVPNN